MLCNSASHTRWSSPSVRRHSHSCTLQFAGDMQEKRSSSFSDNCTVDWRRHTIITKFFDTPYVCGIKMLNSEELFEQLTAGCCRKVDVAPSRDVNFNCTGLFGKRCSGSITAGVRCSLLNGAGFQEGRCKLHGIPRFVEFGANRIDKPILMHHSTHIASRDLLVCYACICMQAGIKRG